MHSAKLSTGVLESRALPADRILASEGLFPSAFRRRWIARAVGAALIVGACAIGLSVKSPDEAQWLRGLANSGDSGAQLEMGLAYRDGRLGLTPDPEASRHWLQAAAAGGNSYAADALANSYASDGHAAAAPQSAVQWWRKAAAGGNADAQRHLGEVLVQEGSIGEAQAWLRKAAVQGQPEAKQDLEGLYRQNLASAGGVTRDGTLATLAARLHSATLEVLSYVSDVLARVSLEPQSVKALRIAAEGGDPVAEYQLGVRYRDGAWGVQRDPGQARVWLTRAADSGNTLAGQAIATL